MSSGAGAAAGRGPASAAAPAPAPAPVPAPASVPAASASAEESLYIAERLLGTVRDDVSRADTKAAVLLSGALAMPALLLGGRWPPGGVAGVWLVPLSAGCALWAAGTALLVWTILPRTRTARSAPGITYYGDAHRIRDPEALVREVAMAGRDRVGWLVTQLVDMSGILAAKYRCLRWGLYLLAPGLALSGVVLVRA